MSSKFNFKALFASAAIGLTSTAANAGGPLFLAEAEVPLAYDVSSPVPVYTDLGQLCKTNGYPWESFGCLTPEQSQDTVTFALAQWSSVATSSFRAQVVGDVGELGIGDITADNVHQVIGAFNGGGITVIFDEDGTIVRDFLGAPDGVLGIASPEFAAGGEILESWVVINSVSVPDGDDGAMTAGVVTHEVGHAINLSHSQVNGPAVFNSGTGYSRHLAPGACGAPYDAAPIADFLQFRDWLFTEAVPNLETMAPFIAVADTGIAQSVVDHPDDRAALSNIYPATNWPSSHASVQGELLLKDGSTELTGINIVARNVNDPLGDAISAMSGDQTQGQVGPDGRFAIHGLTPGESYVVYAEEIRAGGFPTPPATLPSMPEYWNGSGESGDAAADDPCAWTPVVATAGQAVSTDIVMNGVPRSPMFVQIPVGSATDVSSSGKVIAGVYGGGITWMFDLREGEFTAIASDATPRLANDGQTTFFHEPPVAPPWEGGVYQPGIWSEHKGATLVNIDGMATCDGAVYLPFDISGNGKALAGLGYRNGCPWAANDKFYATTWSADAGLAFLETPDVVLDDLAGCDWQLPAGCPVYGSRGNVISGDGLVVAGHVDAVGWKGAAWFDGKLQMIGAEDPKGYVGSVNAINHGGNLMAGGGAGELGTGAYLWSTSTGLRDLGHFEIACDPLTSWFCFPPYVQAAPTTAWGMSEKGDIVIGTAGNFFTGQVGWIWTEQLGLMDFDMFLERQGILEAINSDLIGPRAISNDGKTIVGWGLGTSDVISFAVRLDQVWICSGDRSKLVGFPGAMAAQLANGAEFGLCEADLPITP